MAFLVLEERSNYSKHEYLSDYGEKEGNTNIDDKKVDRVLLKVLDITHDMYNKFRLSGSHFDILIGRYQLPFPAV